MNTQITTESLIASAKHWDNAQWTKECAGLSPEQLTALTPLAQKETHLNWKERLHQLFLAFPDGKPMEAFAQSLNATQVLEIVHFAKNSAILPKNLHKMSSLFVGISPKIFGDFLSQAADDELSFLKEEAITEAVQHHLSLLTNELQVQFINFGNQLEEKEQEIKTLELESISAEEIAHFYRTLDSFHAEGKKILELTSRTLLIAWNANRIDLIQQLGRIRELCQKCLKDHVGVNANDNHPSSGLHQLMEKKIETLFSDRDSNGNLTLMKDNTPALEALVKFNVWYIKDYREVGLLPPLDAKDTPKLFPEQEDFKHREQLFKIAESNLGKLGFHTLADLKRDRIYSKKALIEYIKKHKK